MSFVPQYPRQGAPISAQWGQDICNQLRRSQVLNGTQGSGGTVIGKPAKRRRRKAVSNIPLTPFQIYQRPQDPNQPLATDWRTVSVHRGILANRFADNDDGGANIEHIVCPQSTTGYKIYLDATITTAKGFQQGSISALTIYFSAGGWASYPDQPQPNAPGEPPPHLFILLGTTTTSNDTLQQLQIFQTVTSSLWADIVGYDIECTSTGLALLSRFSISRM